MRYFLVLALALCFSLPAHAANTNKNQTSREDNWPRWYVGLTGGVQFLDDSDYKSASSGKITHDSTGGAFTASLGYIPHFGVPILDNIRVEGELGYHYSKLTNSRSGNTTTALHGYQSALSYMGNVLYDFHNNSQWTPYLGGGVGGARVKLDDHAVLGNNSDGDTTMAYQFLVGIGYAPTSIPFTEWTLGYRYFVAESAEFGTTGASKLKLDNYVAHSVEVGGRFRF